MSESGREAAHYDLTTFSRDRSTPILPKRTWKGEQCREPSGRCTTMTSMHPDRMCFPVRKKSGRSSLALAVWNSSLSLNRHSSSSSSLPTVCLKELRSALMTHRVAPAGERRGKTL
ncbi:hypothetical protein EYF80_017389 [Liparis tanakae]|uniref:Uncharacterized protein n=1 Tax=Liparis tanakae TaxID=230148 RepID=A0A4Z2I3G0_9TELE|nr:hypothetical protein EYF80_017389 [Liparis tanakae]